ncbi:MAG TPA: nuclear transport factor 2 family protein [Micromonosporaceae bacterium]
MGPKLYNAVRLYVDGIRDGHLAAALDKYVSADLVQHTPGVPAGRDGLAAMFQPLIDRYERRTVIPLRGFEDGSRVFLHTFACYGYRAVERVTMDIFDTDDDDHIIEHWSVSAPLLAPVPSGASPIDGPRIATDVPATEANTRLVRTVLGTGGAPAGIEHGHPALGVTRIDQLVGHGSLVAAIGVRDRLVVADLFRVEAARIAEHWGVRTPGGLG